MDEVSYSNGIVCTLDVLAAYEHRQSAFTRDAGQKTAIKSRFMERSEIAPSSIFFRLPALLVRVSILISLTCGPTLAQLPPNVGKATEHPSDEAVLPVVNNDAVANRKRVTIDLNSLDLTQKLERIPSVDVDGKRISFNRSPYNDRTNAFFSSGFHRDHIGILKSTEKLGDLFFISQRVPIALDDFKLLRDVPMTGLVLDGPFTDAHVESLKGHPNLESIALWKTQVTDSSMDILKTFPKLVKISIQFGEVTDVGLAKIADIRQLAVVNLFKCSNITDDGVLHLAKLAELEQLFLNNNEKLTDKIIKPISTLKELNRLELGEIKLTADDMAQLTVLKKLETLGLSKSGMDDAGAKYLSQLTSLKSLQIQEAAISDDGVEQLSRLIGLKQLSLSKNNFGDSGVSALANLTNLTSLSLSSTKVTDKGLRELTTLVNLKSLNLENTAVTNLSVPVFESLVKLESLYLKETMVTASASTKLYEHHPGLGAIRLARSAETAKMLGDVAAQRAQLLALPKVVRVITEQKAKAMLDSWDRSFLEDRFRQKIDELEKTFDLTETHSGKLNLASQSDITRLLRVIGQARAIIAENPKDLVQLSKMIEQLSERLNHEIVAEDSLTAKVLGSILTEEQRQSFKLHSIDLAVSDVERTSSLKLLPSQRQQLVALLDQQPGVISIWNELRGYKKLADVEESKLADILTSAQLQAVSTFRLRELPRRITIR